ncbi:Cilia- and flagella-associated protein 299 [Vulpes lagopus]
MEQDEGLTAVDNVVTQFNTYEDFLDSQITTVDLYYLEDESLARQLVELGYRGTGEVVKREDFEARKAAIEIAMLAERTQKKSGTGGTVMCLQEAICRGTWVAQWLDVWLQLKA